MIIINNKCFHFPFDLLISLKYLRGSYHFNFKTLYQIKSNDFTKGYLESEIKRKLCINFKLF